MKKENEKTCDARGIDSARDLFMPHPLLRNAHLQTVVAYYCGYVPEPPSVTEIVSLDDGDAVTLEITTPTDWNKEQPTVLMLHGLCGSHNSSYLKRLTHKITREGARVVRMNLRNAGSGKGLARKSYHGGMSGDLETCIFRLYKKNPRSPLSVIGFSLGGSLLLKLLGENPSIHSFLKRAIVICPAISLESSSRRFEKLSNFFYRKNFLKSLKNQVLAQRELYPPNLLRSLRNCRSIYEFDDKFTAPYHGFKNAEDYYKKSSAVELIPYIRLKTHVLFAKDDPLVDCSLLKTEKIPENMEVLITETGGHIGFLGHPKKSHFRWMDYRILTWLELS